MEIITAIKDIIVILSAISATIFAFMGLTTWRKELKGKSEYQLAKEVLKSVYKVRDAFMHVRNPAIFQYEYPEEMQNHFGHLKPEYEYEGTLHVYQKRWEVMTEAFRELEEHHLDAQVEWGSEFKDVITNLRTCKSDLQIAIMNMLDHKKDSPEFDSNNADERSLIQKRLYGSESDNFTKEINSAIKEFEKWLRLHIKR